MQANTLEKTDNAVFYTDGRSPYIYARGTFRGRVFKFSCGTTNIEIAKSVTEKALKQWERVS